MSKKSKDASINKTEDKPKAPPQKLHTNKWQRQWAMTKTSATVGSKLAGKMWMNALSNPLDKVARDQKNKAVLSEQAQYLAQELGKLKGSVVKVGQMMALYGEHILPLEVHQALKTLEEQNSPIDFALIQAQIETQLGDTLGVDLNNYRIDQEPLGAASLAQVHRVQALNSDCLIPGDACLKVQYPHIKDTIDSDLDTIVTLLKVASLGMGSEFDAWVEEIRELLYEEVDYLREAAMTTRFADFIAQSNQPHFQAIFHVPAVYAPMSTDSVLCMEMIDGVAVNQLPPISLARRNRLAKAFLSLFIEEVFAWKTLQTDPNFGNYRVALGEDEQGLDDTIGLLDFGSVREFDDDFVEPVKAMVLGAYLQDQARLIKGAIDLGMMQADFPQDVLDDFYAFCVLLLEPFHLYKKPNCELSDEEKALLNDEGAYCWAKSQLPKRAAKRAAKSAMSTYFKVPPKDFALLSRKLLGVYAFISTLDAQFNPEGVLEPWLAK